MVTMICENCSASKQASKQASRVILHFSLLEQNKQEHLFRYRHGVNVFFC